jgi:hypothetical protein
VDAPKIFNEMQPELADLYTIKYNTMLSGACVTDLKSSIPLGIRVYSENQTFKFNLVESNLPYDIILEDRIENKQYNLSKGEVCQVSGLKVGDLEGRFYLNIGEKAEEQPDDDVTTDVEDSVESSGIDIYTQSDKVVVSASENVNLKTIVISDMSGRYQIYSVKGQYVELQLPVTTGVYTLKAIGDTQTRVEKIKLN